MSGTVTIYQAGAAVASGPIETFSEATEGTTNTVTVTVALPPPPPPGVPPSPGEDNKALDQLDIAYRRGTQIQSIYLVQGGFQMTFETVKVISFKMPPPRPGIKSEAAVTFSYEGSMPVAP